MTHSTLSRLSPPELRAAALDGDLHPLGGGYLPLDLPLDPATRLTALAPDLDDARIIVSLRCAAWVWGWTTAACPMLCCSVSSRHRIPSTRRRELSVREVAIDADEIAQVEGTPITTRLRTLIDLARHDDAGDVHSLLEGALRDEASASALSELRVEAALARRPAAAHVRRARERLRRARIDAAQPLLTR